MHAVFVYGSLRRGGSAAEMLEGDRSNGRLPGHALYGRTLPYPFVVPDPESSVVGDVVALGPDADAVLRTLDEYEGDEYRRTALRVFVPSGAVTAWVWVAARDPHAFPAAERIATGDWFTR